MAFLISSTGTTPDPLVLSDIGIRLPSPPFVDLDLEGAGYGRDFDTLIESAKDGDIAAAMSAGFLTVKAPDGEVITDPADIGAQVAGGNHEIHSHLDVDFSAGVPTAGQIMVKGGASKWVAGDIADGAFVPTAGTDWPDPDPTTIQEAGDKLAARVTALEALPGTDDQTAVEVPYTPTTPTDWPDPDPTEVLAALDKTAARTTALEGDSHTHANKVELDLITDGDHDVRTDNPHSVTAAQAGAIPAGDKGAANGVAELDGTGKVPASQLPSYVDDVLAFANLAAFPGTGEAGKIYVAEDTGKIYRWTGAIYVEISPDAGAPVASVFGRTGTVVAASGDYSGDLIDFAPAELGDWTGGTDPGQVDDGLDQLASRTKALEAVSHAIYSHPNHSGDVTSVGDGVQTIAANAVDNTKAADMPAETLKGNDTLGAADPKDLTAAEVRSMLGLAINYKAGTVAPGSFTGNPRTASVVFATAFADANYSVTFTPVSSSNTTWSPAVVSGTKLATGFDVQMGSNSVSNLTELLWVAIKHGESG